MARILIVEDNRNLAHGLRTNLEFEGHTAEVAEDGAAGLALARPYSRGKIPLDLMLPEPDGFRVLETIRAEGVETPVLVLTARGDEADKVRGLRNGADDYVTKPFALRELLARVAALLRRSKPAPGQLAFGEVVVDPATHGVTRSGAPVTLRPKEYELLVALLRRGGAVVDSGLGTREVWGYDYCVTSRTVDTHMAELRRKLEDDPGEPRHFLTVWKAGYRFTP